MEAIAEKDIEVVIDNVGEVSTDSALEVDVIDNTELAVSVNRKEFNIVGDELYIPKRYEDAPQWLRDLISTVTEESYARKITDLNNLSTSLQQLIVELDVAKNTYTQSIISSNDIDERINTAITTLNSSLSGSDATIVDLVSTKATPEEAGAIALNTISSSINDGEIGALVGAVSNTLATETGALANNIDLVHAEMLGGFESTADIIRVTQAYVGIDETGASTGTGLLADVSILQKQNDGVIETVTGTYDVMINPQDPNLAELVLTAEPYASWKAKDVSGIDNRLAHIGDVYIKYNTTSNGAREYVASYKFIRTTVDSTSPYATDSDGFTWALIIDQAAQDAYQQSLNAYDLADNKRRVFTATPTGPIDEGDLWVTGTNPQVVKVYKSGNWELSDTQVDNFISVTYTPTVTSLQNQIDGKVESWYTLSTNDPKTVWTDASTRAKHDGDMWYQTDTKRSYWYSSSTNSWNLIDDAKAIQALADAATAQATADGKISSYYMSTLAAANVMSNAWTATEKTNNIGDLVVVWNDSTLDNNGTWRWNGTNWVTTRDKKLIALASDVTNLSTELTNGTNTWSSADSTLKNSLRTEITGEGARVESKFAYNSTLMLNGTSYNSGFGIATSLTSGSGLPTGQSEFWIKADKFKLMSADGGKKSSYSPFTVDSVTGEINFNGKVTFSNVTGYTPPDISGEINTNNDVFAQKLGYPTYAALEVAAAAGKTVVVGGYVNTNLIQAGAITANQINTTGLIAESISTNELVGKTISGSVINGARINGSVIKASYLDLDGELEVLTNYHISVATRNANPSLYTDAVYISADNEYRIPSISIIKETDSVSNGNGCSIYGTIRSYNTANAGHNNKAVKIRPYFIISENVTLFKTYYTTEDTKKTQRGILYLGNILLIDASMSNDILTINGINYDMPDTDPNSSTARSANITLTIYGLSITVSAVRIGSGGGLLSYSNSGLSIVLNATTGVYLGANFEDTTRGFYIKDLSSAYSNAYSKSSCSISSKISINNMI